MKACKNIRPYKMLGKMMVLAILLLSSCEKFVEIDRLQTQLLAEQVFENEAMATSAITGLYKDFRGSIPGFISFRNATYSDEVVPYLNSASSTYYINALQANDTTLPWGSFYTVIYGANNAIEKLNASSAIPHNKKQQLIAEAKFMRAFCHFYLVNFFGDVPLVLSTDVNTNRNIARTPIAEVYKQIIIDLKDAKALLPDDYAHAANERVKANKWVAAAMLARVYLYQKDYTNAELEANAVITSGKYSLLTTPTGISNKNNNEAILQLANNSTEGITVASSYIYTGAPTNVLTPTILNAFETNDLRKTTWVRTQTYSGQPVSIPYKLTSTSLNPPEYYTLIRLAEMYLIRAEAKSVRSDFQGCADDVNLIRLRHGGLNTPFPAPIDQTTALTMVLHERQVDLFTEGCHRFFDLKRTGRLDAAMLQAKPTYWKATAKLYPIPLTEMQRNPSMTPNPGYE